MEKLPRTLVVSEAPFGQTNGFGVTLNTFFDGWSGERVFMLYTRKETASATAGGSAPCVFADVPGPWGRRHAAEFLLGRRPTWRGRYSSGWLRRTLRGWRPDVVYSMVFSGETLAFATWVARQLDVPLVAHVADDSLETQKGGVSASIGQLLAGAAARISISEEMREEYSRRYGVESHVLHNGAADDLFSQSPAADNRTEPFVVRYLGSIVPCLQFGAIEDIAAAVRQLAAAGQPVRFELCGGAWTRHHAETLTDGEAVVYRGEVGKAEGFDLLKSADVLVIPISFTDSLFSAVRLSLPTKLAECLASGTPTLVYGPRGTAPVEFCRRHNVGCVIDERSVERVAAFIQGTVRNRRAARLAAASDREFIRRHYTAMSARDTFRAIIRDVAAAAR
jgi:glycosyltransferase involved in cell wall biosynthesis